MENFDKHTAMEVIEDALADMGFPHGRGVATGLCGAFYMCGLLNMEEWDAYMKRIPEEPNCVDGSGIRRTRKSVARTRSRMFS
jgi:hypothetical protein